MAGSVSVIDVSRARELSVISQDEMTRWFNDAIHRAATARNMAISVVDDLAHQQASQWVHQYVVSKTMSVDHPFAVTLDLLRVAGYNVTVQDRDTEMLKEVDVFVSW